MWQTRLGQCIYTSESGYKVYQNYFFRWLTLGSKALQTVISRRKPQRPILHYLRALSLMARCLPNETCLLGLGGGGIVHLLHSHTHLPLRVVDNSEEVIQIAKQFFFIDSIPNLEIFPINALEYLRDFDVHHAHLIVDLYDAHQFPIECKNEDFFALCKRRLAEDGFLAVNLANIKEQSLLVQWIKNQFKCTIVIPIKKSANMVVIAADTDDKEWFLQKIMKTGEIKKILLDSSWGYVADY